LASDTRRERIAELWAAGDFDENGDYYSDAVENLELILSLLEAEGLGGHLGGMLERSIADILHETEHRPEALLYAMQSLEAYIVSHGPGFAATQEMHRYSIDQTLPPV